MLPSRRLMALIVSIRNLAILPVMTAMMVPVMSRFVLDVALPRMALANAHSSLLLDSSAASLLTGVVVARLLLGFFQERLDRAGPHLEFEELHARLVSFLRLLVAGFRILSRAVSAAPFRSVLLLLLLALLRLFRLL